MFCLPLHMMTRVELITDLGDEIGDPEEETFLLFSQDNPSQNLGCVDSDAPSLQLTVAGRNLLIQQSPSLLKSVRPGGTTGAVVWKISPLFAEWMASPANVFFNRSILGPESNVLELGCGISGLVALALGPNVGRYIATDQNYIMKLLKQNLDRNPLTRKPPMSRKTRDKHITADRAPACAASNIEVLPLDWELSALSSLPTLLKSNDRDPMVTFDAVMACDCIYNEALVEPFVQACAEICRLRTDSGSSDATICIVAQQLRSPLVFEAWLISFYNLFRVWRLPDDMLTDDLKSNSSYVVHLGLLREVDE